MPVKRRSGPPGCAGGGCGAAERGAGKGGGGAEARGLVGCPRFSHMGGAAERRTACGRKNKHEPSFSGKKTKNLRFRVFLATLLGGTIQVTYFCIGAGKSGSQMIGFGEGDALGKFYSSAMIVGLGSLYTAVSRLRGAVVTDCHHRTGLLCYCHH
jgi:hypothetical protein